MLRSTAKLEIWKTFQGSFIPSILYLKHIPTGLLVAYVAIGALLVGSIQWTGGKEKGTVLKRGDELGHFAYGGSTIVVVFPKELMEFDRDLVSNSKKPIETLVKVGDSIGKTPMKAVESLCCKIK